MELPVVDFSTAVNSFIAAMQAKNPNLTDTSENSVCLAFAEASGHNLQTLQNIAINLLAVTRLATSSGTDVDTFGSQFGFTRLPSTYASDHVTFSRNSTNIIGVIPVGTQVQTADGSQTFTVVEDTTNLNWNGPLESYAAYPGTQSIDVPVVADNPGVQGNAAANTITVLGTALTGIDTVTNSEAFTNASPNESDDEFRQRFVLFINTRALGTKDAIKYAITSYQQGISLKVLDAKTIDGNLAPATTTVYVDDGSGNTPTSTIQALRGAVEPVRAAGTIVNIIAATLIEANINFTLNVVAGVNKNTVIAAINSSVPGQINALQVGDPLVYLMIPAMIYNAAPGQIASIEALTLNGGVVDIGGNANQVIRLQSLTVS